MSGDSDTKLGDAASVLLTEAGYLNAMENLFAQLSGGGLTRDETSALIGARRCLQSFADAREGKLRTNEHKELIKDMRKTREALKQKGAGASSLTDEQLPLPRRTSKGTPKK